jgi:hypothetical protein
VDVRALIEGDSDAILELALRAFEPAYNAWRVIVGGGF